MRCVSTQTIFADKVIQQHPTYFQVAVGWWNAPDTDHGIDRQDHARGQDGNLLLEAGNHAV
jgi:hypothetical protein